MIIDLTINSDYIKINGRSMQDNGIAADWTDSGIEFNAKCQGSIFVTFRFENNSKLFYSSYVDGEKTRICVTDYKTDKPNIFKAEVARNLKPGKHNILLEKQSEAEHGCSTITEIELDGELCRKPSCKALFIEFIGDSITAGYGNLITNNAGQEIAALSEYEDGSDTYAAVASRILNADFQTVCRKGTGIVNGWDSSNNPLGAICNTYEQTCFYRNKTAVYDFARQPDIVVINLGTNDTWTFKSPEANHGVTDRQMTDGIYERFCQVAKHNPKAKIVWAFGLMTDRIEFPYAYKWFDDAIARFEKEQHRIIYICELPRNHDGGNFHPSVSGHKAAGIVLAEFIKNNIL